MHDSAYSFVERTVHELEIGPERSVAEFGSRDVNGSVRPLFGPDFTGLDVTDGPGVDIVADGAKWIADRKYDCVVSCEVLEHAEDWREIVANMARCVRSGGSIIITCATGSRKPHSAVDGGSLRDLEYYGNVDPEELRTALKGFSEDIHVEVRDVGPNHGDDLYCWMVKA